MADTTNKPKQATAREMLRPSVLRQTQLELMGDDVDVSDLYLTLNHSGIDIEEAVLDATVERTMQGASTITVTVYDRDFTLLRSGRLSARNDTEIDGLFFRLKGVNIDGHTLILTFEDREVAVMRTYSKPIKQSLQTARGRITRAEFILRMLKEIVEVPITYVIPELHKIQPIDGASQQPLTLHQQQQRGLGIPKVNNLRVKTADMTENHRKVANTILTVGASRQAVQRPLLVMAIMCAIQESTLTNLPMATLPSAYNYLSPDPDYNPVGVFQQIPHWWRKKGGATRDVAKDATAFYNALAPVYAAHPDRKYQDLIDDDSVQNSGNPGGYGQWRDQAERIVDAFGITSGTAASANQQWAANAGAQNYEFYRGLPPTGKLRKQKYGGQWGPENTWDCIQRLAQEVNWRAFFVSGVFYFMSEDQLFKSQPIATIDHSSPGIDNISGDYDEGKKTANLSLECRIGRWQAPPGSVVQVMNMGPWNGRWLVNDITRSLFSPQGTVNLKKPLPRLPEPSGANIIKDQSAWTGNFKPKDDTGKGGTPKAPSGDRTTLAQKLLTAHDLGTWIDENGRGLAQIQATAAGQQVQSPLGFMCYLDSNILRVVLWLIQQGYKIGTYAWCSDHSTYDGPRGHQGGYAVDIESINHHHIAENSTECRKLTLEVATLIHDIKGPMAPRQLITGGYGNHRDDALTALSIPGADSYYGSRVMGEHCNHIHYGAAIRESNPGKPMP